MLVDAEREVTQDVLVEAQRALELDHRLGRGGDVHEREMRLAVLLDAVRQGLQAPGLDLGDRAAERRDLRLQRSVSVSTCCCVTSWRARKICS